MRTKTLLIAAATLATGLLASKADNVYSANVVGYANVSTPSAFANYLISVPFNVGVSNGANEVFGSSLPDGSSILLWNGAGYDTYFSDSGSPSGWDDAGFNPLTSVPTLPVGKGFFLSPAASTTNTFVGTIAIATGTTNSTVFPTAFANYLVGGSVPYGGAVTNGSAAGGGLALSSANGLPDGSSILIWNGAGYDTYFSDSGSPSGWDDAGFNPLATPPSVNVGQGFFLSPAASYTWKVGLSAN